MSIPSYGAASDDYGVWVWAAACVSSGSRALGLAAFVTPACIHSTVSHCAWRRRLPMRLPARFIRCLRVPYRTKLAYSGSRPEDEGSRQPPLRQPLGAAPLASPRPEPDGQKTKQG